VLNGLSLFTGIGGLDVALSDWVRPLAYCEIDPYCQAVILSRISTRDLEQAPIWNDIRTLNAYLFEGAIDIIYGGFPCQDISITGKGKGLEGERSGLFFEILRLAEEIKPEYVFLENVAAITSRGGLRVVREIAEMGYDCRWCTISASSIGALHKRERWFLLAHAKSKRLEEAGQPIRQEEEFPLHYNTIEYEGWDKEPKDKFAVVGMANGIQDRTHRIRALGNAVVPHQAREAFKVLMGIKKK
jgi:DNA (cytosine-5)-methyltransferase 1